MQMNWQDLSGKLSGLWQTELYKAGETPIFLSQVIIAIVLIIIGFVVVRWLGANLAKRALRSSGASENTVYAFRRLISFFA